MSQGIQESKMLILDVPITHQESEEAVVSNSRQVSWFLKGGSYMN